MMIKKAIRFSVVGLLIGSFLYLLNLLFVGGAVTVHPQDVISNMLMSIVIGLASLIFSYDRINFYLELIIHFIFVMVIVSLVMSSDGAWTTIQTNPWIFYAEVAGMYILVWVGLHISLIINVKKMNEAIKKRKSQTKTERRE